MQKLNNQKDGIKDTLNSHRSGTAKSTNYEQHHGTILQEFEKVEMFSDVSSHKMVFTNPETKYEDTTLKDYYKCLSIIHNHNICGVSFYCYRREKVSIEEAYKIPPVFEQSHNKFYELFNFNFDSLENSKKLIFLINKLMDVQQKG